LIVKLSVSVTLSDGAGTLGDGLAAGAKVYTASEAELAVIASSPLLISSKLGLNTWPR
jgi:hypothetical protein